MDNIQKVLIKAGRKDLAIEYYNKIAGKIKGPGIPDGTGPMKDSEECPYKKEDKEATAKKASPNLQAIQAVVNKTIGFEIAKILDNL